MKLVPDGYNLAKGVQCYELNLCGNDAAVCIPEAITYLGTMHLIQLQPQEAKNIGKADWLFAS